MFAKFNVTYKLFTQKTVDELNLQSDVYYIELSEQMGLTVPPDIFLITCELLKNIEYNMAYDIFKNAILSIYSKFKKIQHNQMEKTEFIISYNGIVKKIIFPFNLTEEQKDKLVNAAIEELLKN
ncbi:MAG: hypothetical protein IKS17_11085 [Firmicutes bacterium]|nr:hypothetical protein [Bacillota bacterium]